MRPWLYGAALLAAATIVPPPILRGLLATTASVLFESLPFILAGTLLARVPALRRLRLATFLGCGCGTGPGALSIPTAVATAIAFGPAIAAFRFVAACGVAWCRRDTDDHHHESAAPPALAELGKMLPSAIMASIAAILLPFMPALSIPAQLLLGSVLGLCATPCALGGVALAASLHAHAPLACDAILATSGLVDVAAWRHHHATTTRERPFAYYLLAFACAFVGLRGGDLLVHPIVAAMLVVSSTVLIAIALRIPRGSGAAGSLIPAIMLAGAVLRAPLPAYTATETTLTDLFVGEHVAFTGTLVTRHGRAALVRYAILCCRADARPIVLRLTRMPPQPRHAWFRVEGSIVRSGATLALDAHAIVPIAAPADPFVYW